MTTKDAKERLYRLVDALPVFTRLRDVGPLLGVLAVGCAHRNGHATPRVTAAATSLRLSSDSVPATRDERWRADLRYFAAELPARHVDMYRHTTRGAFARGVVELDSAIPSLTNNQVRLRFLRLTAMLRDGHSGASAVTWPPAERLPIETLWTDDGPYVVGTSAPYASLVGQRMTSVNGYPIRAVTDTLSLYIPHENEIGFRRPASLFLVIPVALQGAGLARDTTRVTMELETRSGSRSRVELPVVRWDAFAPVPPAGGEPLYRQRVSEKYWFAYLQETRTVLVEYNQCRDSADFHRMVDSAMSLVDTGRVARVVIDLRHNGGGSSWVINPLIAALRARPAIDRPRALYVVVGRETFSSGLAAAQDFRHRTHATIIGEPIGERPNNSFGEVRTFALPYSGLAISYSTKIFNVSVNDPEAFYPDVAVPPTPESIVAGRDPAMEWILAQR